MFLLGTKTDIRNESSVDPDEVRKLATSLHCRPLEISAKESTEMEVNALFEYITEVIYKRHLQNQIKPKYTDTTTTNTSLTENALSTNTETDNIGFTEKAPESDSENQDIHTIEPLQFGGDPTNERSDENFTFTEGQVNDINLSEGDNIALTEVELNDEDI